MMTTSTSTPEDTADGIALPEFLFHVTPLRNLASIRERGLLASMKRWDSSYDAGVYLGTEAASSEYSRFTGETGANEDDIEFVVLKVSTKYLHSALFRSDDWEISNHWDELELCGYPEERFDDVPWHLSLALTGQVIFLGDIPAEALAVHATIGCDLKVSANLSGSSDVSIKSMLKACRKDNLTYGEAIRHALDLHRSDPDAHSFERLHGALSEIYTCARICDLTDPIFAK